MDFLSQDREIGPELVTLLTHKLKTTKEALCSVEDVRTYFQSTVINIINPFQCHQENQRLKTQLAEARQHLEATTHSKTEGIEAPVGYTCQEGICPVS